MNQKNSQTSPKGGLVLCCNRVSSLDPELYCAAFSQAGLFHVKKKIELFRNKFVRAILGFVNSFLLTDLESAEIQLLKLLEVSKAGNVYGIFPEGIRSIDGEMGATRRGWD